jgi:hypothetical protein
MLAVRLQDRLPPAPQCVSASPWHEQAHWHEQARWHEQAPGMKKKASSGTVRHLLEAAG